MGMQKLTAEKYRELFKLRAIGKLDHMECTKRLYDLLKPLYFKGMKILDIPCGAGHYFRKIKELGEINYFGIDLDAKAVEIARELWKKEINVTFDVQNASKLKFENNSFDIVFCYNLLLHLEDYKEVLKELFRVSKKYIFIRSLFDEVENKESIKASEDYQDVYNSGVIFYNTYAREEVIQFVNNLGASKIEFISDNLEIPEEVLKKQENLLQVNSNEFARGIKDEKQEWKGLSLNYEILFIEKL